MDRSLLPIAPSIRPVARMALDVSTLIQARWNPDIRAAVGDSDTTISMLDVIGEDWDGSGVTSTRISAALRGIGGKDVTVNINSPGGDIFEGLAIYNMLREYSGKVTVRVLGVAASAASIIAMAADELQIARAGFLMIHNASVAVFGNRNDIRAVADTLQTFDATMADIYAARTGEPAADMGALMDAETWIGGADAVEQGFADSLLASDATKEDAPSASMRAERKLDLALAKASIPRAERRKMLQELKSGTPSAIETSNGTPGAVEDADYSAIEFKLALALASFKKIPGNN